MGNMWFRTGVAAPLAVLLAVGCSGETRQFRLVRVVPPAEDADSPCGAPLDGRIVKVNAVGEFSQVSINELIDVGSGAVDLTQFPDTVRALEVVVLGDGGEERTIGRSETFDPSELEDQDEVRVFMAPRRGFCPTGPPRSARSDALVARAGAKVLIAGGFDASGDPVTDAELYDPRTGAFTSIGDITYEDNDPDTTTGMAGASITTMPDGRVVIAGGPADAYTVFDPATETADVPAKFLNDAPAFHAAVALDESRVLLAGGCAVAQVDVATRRCTVGVANVDAQILDIDTGEVQTLGTNLARSRVGGQALLEADGRVLLVGGIDSQGEVTVDAERIDPNGVFPREIIEGVTGVGAPLATGGVVVAYGPDGTPQTNLASAVGPGGDVATPVPAATKRTRPTLTPLEEGRVLVLGGNPLVEVETAPGVFEDQPIDADAQLYIPVDGIFVGVQNAPSPQRVRHSAVRLEDGSVLIVGGTDVDDQLLGDAWIFRPDLTGPFTPQLDVTFEDELAENWVPSDLARVTRIPPMGEAPAKYTIESSGNTGSIPSQWGIIAGPKPSEPKLTTNVSADGVSPGIALILAFRDAENFQYITLRTAQVAELLNLVDGQPIVQGCAGSVVSEDQVRGGPHEVEVEVAGESVTATVDGDLVLSCDLLAPLQPGAVGVGIVGPELDSVTVDRVSVSR